MKTPASFCTRIALFCAVAPVLALSCLNAARAANLPRIWQPVGSPDISGTLIRQDAFAAIIRTADGRDRSLRIRRLGDEDQRYLANMRTATRPFRNWSFHDDRGPQTFHAAYVQITGFDSPLTKQFVVLIHDDGRRRGYPLDNFSDADRDYVRQRQAAEPPAPSSDAVPGDEYQVHWTDYDPVRDKALINSHATKHFLFVWGNQIEPAAKDWADPAFRQMNFDYFEKVWDFNQNVQHAQMPYDGEAQKYKTTVYITGTGLPNQKEGFAFGGLTIEISPAAMLAGSSVIPHEFTHTLQMHMGGFVGSLGPKIGWFWECHANWNACRFIPSVALALEVYNDRMHYELSSSRDNYGSWPFLEYFAEHPRFGPAFCFDVWKTNKKVNGESVETPFQTMMRLGVAESKFTGDGVSGFGDIIGEMAAHNATWDYENEWIYQTQIDAYHKGAGDASRDRTILRPVPDRAGWYRPLYSQSPRQYGINLIDLVPKPDARTVTADFQGIVDEAEGSDWRITLLAVDREGRARYSRMSHGGRLTLALRPGEDRVMLAIAAAPTLDKQLGGDAGYNEIKRHFPYEVAFTGCAPTPVPDYLPPQPDVAGGHHPNGGGFVAASAHADPTAYVAPGAQVLGHAQITGNARIEDHARVTDDAKVSDRAVVRGWATARGYAQITGDAVVAGYATVENTVRMADNAHAQEYIRVHGHGTISGDALLKGFGDVYIGPDAPISGGAIMGQDSEIHADDWHQPITGGLMAGFMAHDSFARGVPDNHFLYAHWDFAQPRWEVLKDAFGDSDGVLRGRPTFIADAGRSVLALNGRDQYAVLEGIPADTAATTWDMRLRWRGGAPMQRVLTFFSGTGTLSFTPRDAAGKAALLIRRGKTLQFVEASRPLPIGRWTRVTVTLGSGSAAIFLDGRKAGQSTVTLRPEDIQATAGFLGCGADHRDLFHGDLGDIAIYRTALPAPPAPAAVPPGPAA
jgi:carbonic anhydrase/acetyltransferase-like protein (isoleucine patch superfamily)